MAALLEARIWLPWSQGHVAKTLDRVFSHRWPTATKIFTGENFQIYGLTRSETFTLPFLHLLCTLNILTE